MAGLSLGIVQDPAMPQSDGTAERQGAEATQEHEHDEDDFGGLRQHGSDAGRSPTVPNAETASKNTRSNGIPVTTMSEMVAIITAATAMSTTVIA